MARENNYNDRQKKPSFGIDDMAQRFVPAIKKMLHLETATTDEIKAGVTMTEDLMKNNKDITAHQVRNIYSLVLDVKASLNPLKDLQLLRPKLAYIGARQKNIHGKVVVKVIDLIILSFDETKGNEKQKIDNLVYIMECIVAYQKFYSKN
jgi:CRISPR type III-A-associated protein Csm2